MSSLLTTHKEYITEKLMLKYLGSGTIPTADQLQEDLKEYQNIYLDLNRPASIYKNWLVDPGSESSASQIKDMLEVFSDDSAIVSREIYRLAGVNSLLFDRWLMETKRLSAYASKLEERVNALLLLNSNTDGYFNCISDTFSDLSKIDTEETDARIDTESGIVVINPVLSESNLNGSAINLSSVTESDVFFNILSKKPGVFYTSIGECKLSNIFKSNNSCWIGKVTSKSSGNMVCELKAKVSKKSTSVSRISIQFSGYLGTSSSSVTCMYSTDGYTWNTVPSVSPSKSIAQNISWVFEPIQLKWIKIILTKQSPDIDGSYIFSISSLRLYGDSYGNNDTGESTLQTASLNALDLAKNPVVFASASLETCEETPSNTGIDYWLSASVDGDTWTDWISVAPAKSTTVLYPKVVHFNGLSYKNNQSNDALLLNDTITSDYANQIITTTFSNETLGSNLVGYKFKNTNYGAINVGIILNEANDSDIISNSIEVWRNIRLSIDNFPDNTLVRNTIRGWGFDGNQYSCYFEILSSSGKVFDFGSSKCVIDGKEYSGIITIPKGVHKLTTDSSNWFDIYDNYNNLTSIPSSEEGIKSIDPLYPYNHKLLIEGYVYPSADGYSGKKIYTGVDMSGEFYMSRTGLFDLENNREEEYEYFAVRSIGNETYPTLCVVVGFDSGNIDYSNELFYVKWKSNPDGSSLYKYIKMKSRLWTAKDNISPSLLSYRVKLGS